MDCRRKTLLWICALTWPVFKVVLFNQIIYTASISAAAGPCIQAAPARPWEGLQPSSDSEVNENADPTRPLDPVALISIAHLPQRAGQELVPSSLS